jgi:hypothetical protein
MQFLDARDDKSIVVMLARIARERESAYRLAIEAAEVARLAAKIAEQEMVDACDELRNFIANSPCHNAGDTSVANKHVAGA